MVAVLTFAVLGLLTLWSVFWVVRLAVRYGVNDALRANRDWLRISSNEDVSAT